MLFLKQIVGVTLWWLFWVWGLWGFGLSDAASRHPPAATLIPVGHPMVPKCQTSNRLSSLLIPDRLPEVACTPVLPSAAPSQSLHQPATSSKVAACPVGGWTPSGIPECGGWEQGGDSQKPGDCSWRLSQEHPGDTTRPPIQR